MNNWSKLVVGAVVAGFLSSQVAVANEPEAAGDATKAEHKDGKGHQKHKGKGKDGCKGKNACKGKDGCKGKAEGEEHPEGK